MDPPVSITKREDAVSPTPNTIFLSPQKTLLRIQLPHGFLKSHSILNFIRITRKKSVQFVSNNLRQEKILLDYTVIMLSTISASNNGFRIVQLALSANKIFGSMKSTSSLKTLSQLRRKSLIRLSLTLLDLCRLERIMIS